MHEHARPILTGFLDDGIDTIEELEPKTAPDEQAVTGFLDRKR